VQRVFDPRLPLFHLDFGRGAHLANATPPASLATRSCSFSCRSRWWFLDLGARLFTRASIALGIARAVDECRLFLVYFNALRLAKVLERCLLEGQADFSA